MPPVKMPGSGMVAFEPNLGQAWKGIRYMARMGSSAVYITDKGAFLANYKLPDPDTLRDEKGTWLPEKFLFEISTVQMTLVGAQPSRFESLSPLESHTSYAKGNDHSKWIDNIPQFAKLSAKSVYPGIDVVYYSKNGNLEYDFVVAAGADPKHIQLAFAGQDGMRVNAKGDIVLATAHGDVVQQRPRVYQEHREIAASYTIKDGNIGIRLARYDASKPLVIDPVIVNSTFFSGTQGVFVNSYQSGAMGGYTFSTDLPLNPGTTINVGGGDAFMMGGLSGDPHTPVASLYFGGSGLDLAQSVDRISSGLNHYYCAGGFTTSNNYPTTTGAYLTAGPGIGQGSGFVSCFYNLSTASVPYSTYIGLGHAQINGIGFTAPNFSSLGNEPLLIAGQVTKGYLLDSFAHPPSGYECQAAGGCTAIGTDLDGVAAFLYLSGPSQGSFYKIEMGGTGDDVLYAISGNDNDFLAAGNTASTDLPTHSAIKGAKTGANANGLLFGWSIANNQPLLTSYYGSNEGGDSIKAVKWGADSAYTTTTGDQNFLLGGYTSGTTWPSIGTPLTPSNQGGVDAFVVDLNMNDISAQTTVVYSSTFGGNGDDTITAVDQIGGDFVVAGQTKSSNLSVVNPLSGQSTLRGASDGLLLRFTPNASVQMLTYLGGSNTDSIAGIDAGNQDGSVYVGGSTASGDFPIVQPAGFTPIQSNMIGTPAGFIAKIQTATSTTFRIDLDLYTGTSSVIGINSDSVPVNVTPVGCTAYVSSPYVLPMAGTCDLTVNSSLTITVPQTYTAPDGAQFTFVKWGDGSTNPTETLTMDKTSSSQGFQAFFLVKAPVTVLTAGSGTGTVTPPSGSLFSEFSAAPIVATPSPGSTFAGWTGSPMLLGPLFGDATAASTTLTVVGPATITAHFTSTRITPTITWTNPAAIAFGSALGTGQLNATASVPGTFSYNPPAGTVLLPGNSQTLSVTFTPTDTTTYSPAAATVSINVLPPSGGGLIVTRTFTRSGANVIVNVTIANAGTAAVSGVTLTSAVFNTPGGPLTMSGIPVVFGTIPADGVATRSFTILNALTNTSGTLTLSGTSSGGSFGSTSRSTLP